MANSADPGLDLHCLQRQGISGFSRTRVNTAYEKCWALANSAELAVRTNVFKRQTLYKQ